MSIVLQGLIRHLLTTAGGALVARGSLSSSDVEIAVGAIMTLAGVIASVVNKRKPATRSRGGLDVSGHEMTDP